MEQVNIHEAKTHLSRLVDRAAAGAEIVIAKAGKPLAKLVPYAPVKPKRQFGLYKGKIQIADDFDAPLPDDLLDLFEGKK
jgi:prevent-host-death family protein